MPGSMAAIMHVYDEPDLERLARAVYDGLLYPGAPILAVTILGLES